MNFTNAVKKSMADQGIRSGELARRMGYSPQYITDLLAGHRRWNETTMDKACQALGMKIQVVKDKDNNNKPVT